jgi:hypothetical protein
MAMKVAVKIIIAISFKSFFICQYYNFSNLKRCNFWNILVLVRQNDRNQHELFPAVDFII